MPIIPTLWFLHPRLAGDRLDHVVAVEALQRLEEVERATRAAGAAHVHVDDREAHQVREHRDAARRSGRVGVAVARVLDQRRVRRQRTRGWSGSSGCRAAGRDARLVGLVGGCTLYGELRAVAGREVPVAAARDRLVVDRRVPRRRALGVHGDRRRLRAVGDPAHAVAARRRARRGTAARRASWRSASRRPCPALFTSDICVDGARPVTYTWRALPTAVKVGVAARRDRDRQRRDDQRTRSSPSRVRARSLRMLARVFDIRPALPDAHMLVGAEPGPVRQAPQAQRTFAAAGTELPGP